MRGHFCSGFVGTCGRGLRLCVRNNSNVSKGNVGSLLIFLSRGVRRVRTRANVPTSFAFVSTTKTSCANAIQSDFNGHVSIRSAGRIEGHSNMMRDSGHRESC